MTDKGALWIRTTHYHAPASPRTGLVVGEEDKLADSVEEGKQRDTPHGHHHKWGVI